MREDSTRPAHPAWLITEDFEDTDLGSFKSGKEAELFLVERCSLDGGRTCLLAHKRYIPAAPGKGELEELGFSRARGFAHDAPYMADKRMKSKLHREKRALAKRTSFGREMLFGMWMQQEWAMLQRLHEEGVSVPYPVAQTEDGILMEYLGDADSVAPRLAQARLSRDEVAVAFDQVIDDLRRLVGANVVHADLSPYNILWWEGRVRVIDLPQAVGLLDHPQGFELLQRDIENVCTWFARRGLADRADANRVLGEVLAGAIG